MSNYNEVATYQTDLVCQWLDNVEDYYLAYIDRLERRGLFDASSAKWFVHHLWGDKTPEGSGMSKVRWGQVAEFLNSSAIEEHWIGMRIEELKRRNRQAGHYFFSKDTMAYFSPIVYPNTRGVNDENGRLRYVLFVTSERFDDEQAKAPRLYTLRRYDLDTDLVDEIGIFQGFLTCESALRAMRNYKMGDEVKAECDPIVLNNPPAEPAVILAGLPGIDVNDEIDQLLRDSGL